jgi:DtxR family Mn-dependent transcriptional regulator
VLSESIQDYLKSVYKLQTASGRVTIGALAKDQGVSPASASAMVKKLAALELLTHQPYQGAHLTEAGEKVALEVIRHHRLLEAFLAERLGMPWDRIHDEAEVLEHYISEEFERRIAAELGDPHLDPHGDPIPSADLDVAADRTVPLAELGPGLAATFARVSDSNPEVLRYLAGLGIKPGATITVLGAEPFGGPLRVDVDGIAHALGPELGAKMRVDLAGGR